MSYDIKFRKRVLEFMDEGHTYAQAYEAFKIFPTVIVAWRKLLEKTGSLEPQKYKHKPKKIDPEKLKKAIEKKPDSYLRELAEKFNCSISAIHKHLVKNDITYKKKHSRMQKNQKKNAKNI
jgi:transposase